VANAGLREEVEQARSKLSLDRRCLVGEEMQFVIPPDRAARLDCRNLGIGLTEVLFWQIDQRLYKSCIWTDGHFSGGGQRRPILTGKTKWIPKPPIIAFFLKWETQADGISITVRAETDSDILSNILKTPDLTADERVVCFVRLWSEVKYNFANFDLVPELNWDNVLSEYLPKVMAHQSNKEYALLLTECVAQLRDGHTSVRSSWGNGLPNARPPLRIRSVGGKAIITEIAKTEEIKASGIKPGDEITHVDERPVREILEKKIYPYIFASTSQGRDLKAYPRILRGLKESTVSLSIKTPGGEIRKVSLTRKANALALLPRRRRTRPSNFEYRDLGDSLAYVALNTFGNEEIVQAFDEKFSDIKRAKGLIIDVRKNGGGSSCNGDAIIRFLIEKAIPHTLWKTPQHIAAFEAWGRPKKWFEGEPEKIEPQQGEKYLGPIVILIGTETFSAAEDFVVPLHAAGRATIVGQKSGGSTGQPLQFSFLDGKIRGRVCTKRDTYPDGREFVGVGIIPDVEVNPTVEDIVNDRDVVLDKGIQILKDKIGPIKK
jgi:C-terminal processing protease CtpA/Prc